MLSMATQASDFTYVTDFSKLNDVWRNIIKIESFIQPDAPKMDQPSIGPVICN